jgi:hypothetical protein
METMQHPQNSAALTLSNGDTRLCHAGARDGAQDIFCAGKIHGRLIFSIEVQ